MILGDNMKPLGIEIQNIREKVLGITQERMAELQNVSPKSIQNYEAGKTLPTDEFILRLADRSGANYIALMYLRESHGFLKDFMPNVEPKDLPAAALSLMKEMADMIKIEKDLIEIACDGKVSADERQRADIIIKEARELIAALTMIVCTLS